MKKRSNFPLSPRAAIVALAFTLGSTIAYAATDAQKQACTGDVFRLCSSEIPNVDRIVACLKREQAKLSAPCQAVMATATASSTRSIAAEQQEWCTFTPGNTEPAVVNWRTWCGAAAR